MTDKKAEEKGKKKRKKKGKKKPDDLGLVLASVGALTAEVRKLVEQLDAFRPDLKRQGPPAPRGGEAAKKTVQKKTVAKKTATKKKALTRKAPVKKAAAKKTGG